MGAISIYQQAEKAARKYHTRNPYELLDAVGAVTEVVYDFPAHGLKGFCTILNKTKYAVINGNLSKDEQRIVAGHEAAHLILHKREILLSPAYALKDFNLYDGSGKLEFEANTFASNFLIADKCVLDALDDPEGNYFTLATELRVPPPLLAFKLYSMAKRGYEIWNPLDLDSKFLRGLKLKGN